MNRQLYKNFKKQIVFGIFIFLLFFNVYSAQAGFIKEDTFKDKQDEFAAGAAGYEAVTDESVLILIQTVINAFLSIIGVILLAYLLYAGYHWMTAQGDEEKVTKAKNTIQRAIIGVIIIVGAYAISLFVMDRMGKWTLQGGSNKPTTSPTLPSNPGSEDLPPSA